MPAASPHGGFCQKNGVIHPDSFFFREAAFKRQIASMIMIITMKIEPQPVAIRESASFQVAGRSAMVCCACSSMIYIQNPPYPMV